jgi:hypothetical protein
LLLPSLKQYVVAPVLLLFALPPRPRPRAIAVAVALAAASAAPFLLWNRRATVDGILFALRAVDFRDDSLSLTALLALATGWRAPRLIGPAAQLAVAAGAFALLRRRGLGGLLLASALALCASFLVGPQAFFNYYFFVEALLLWAALVLAA